MKKDTTRLVISMALIAMFGWAFFNHPDNGLIVGALIAAFTTSVNWWLGSSQGSADKSAQLAEQASSAQPVEVVNDHDEPVPVEPQP